VTDDARQLWDKVIDGLRGKVGGQMIDKLLRPLKALDAADGVLLLQAPNDFSRDWVTKGYIPLVEDTLKHVTGTPWTVCWTASAASAPAPTVAQLPVLRAPAPPRTKTVSTSVSRPTLPTTPPPAPPPSATPSTPPSAPGAPNAPVTASRAPTLRVPPGSLQPSAPRPRDNPPPRMAPSQSAARTSATTPAALRPGAASGGFSAGLSPRYTFDQFVIGPSNQIAYAAAEALANLEGRRFNVLFLCGTTGLGKTHLSNAVGHRVLEQKPDARIMYLSAEGFTNDYVHAIQQKKMEEFRTRYRVECDALLIDDVQFLAGREGTQEEFFHTFNALTQRGAAIVLTSDVLPERLMGMAERLQSRFQQGLVAEITTPEMETRVAILRKKAELENVRLDDDAAFLIASMPNANVRELEGTLMKLAIKAGILGRGSIDAGLVRDTLRLGTRPTVVTVEDVQRAACEHYRIKMNQLVGKERHREVAVPRQMAMYLARTYLGTSFPQIGLKFGGKDHTTVISAVRRVDKLLGEEPELMAARDTLCAKLGFNPTEPVVGPGGYSTDGATR
jgi:chromosomal replication initiator protein